MGALRWGALNLSFFGCISLNEFCWREGSGLYAFSIRAPIPIDTKKPPYIVGWFFVLIKYYYLVCVIISVVMVVANEANEIHTEGVLKVLPTAFDSRLRLSLGAT